MRAPTVPQGQDSQGCPAADDSKPSTHTGVLLPALGFRLRLSHVPASGIRDSVGTRASFPACEPLQSVAPRGSTANGRTLSEERAGRGRACGLGGASGSQGPAPRAEASSDIRTGNRWK